MKIAVVILNWNGKDLLNKFLPSIIEYSEGAQIYVADNASTDDSVDFVIQNHPSVKIIQNQVNGGYAKGYNDALKTLSEDIYVLLNSDVEVTPNWLDPIISKFSKDNSIAAAQPKILDYKNKEYFEYAGAAGGYLDKLGYPFCRGRIFNTLEKDNGQYNDTREIFWASGACLFVRANAFWEAGALDEDYFAHQEEIDLCWRIKAKGGKIIYDGSSEVFHVGGATLDSGSPEKTFYNFRNSLFNLLKNKKGIFAFILIFSRISLDTIVVFQFLFAGKPRNSLAIIKAHFSFYRHIPKFLPKRKNHASKMVYYRIPSIVFQYFILGKKTYPEL